MNSVTVTARRSVPTTLLWLLHCCDPSPVAVGGHADGISRETGFGDEVGHFFGGEGGVEGLGEEAALVGRGVGGVDGDEVV